MPSPLEALIDAACTCQTCGLPPPLRVGDNVGRCRCWECCSCGWFIKPGGYCRNPETRRCTGKLRGIYNRSTREYDPRPGQ